MTRYSGLSDEELALLVQKGDKEAFGDLVLRYQEKISRYARRFVVGTDIDDLVQDVFIKAYVNINSFDASRRFSPWLYRVAHNEFANALRKKRSIPFSFFDYDVLLPLLSDGTKASDEAEAAEIRQLLDSYLSDLSAKYREPLLLFYYEDLSYEDIADILAVPVATVGVRLKRAREILKNKLKNYQN